MSSSGILYIFGAFLNLPEGVHLSTELASASIEENACVNVRHEYLMLYQVYTTISTVQLNVSFFYSQFFTLLEQHESYHLWLERVSVTQ